MVGHLSSPQIPFQLNVHLSHCCGKSPQAHWIYFYYPPTKLRESNCFTGMRFLTVRGWGQGITGPTCLSQQGVVYPVEGRVSLEEGIWGW